MSDCYILTGIWSRSIQKSRKELNDAGITAYSSLAGAPGLHGNTLSTEEEQVVFDGTAREAIAGFPKNVNVAVASAFASVVTAWSVASLLKNLAEPIEFY